MIDRFSRIVARTFFREIAVEGVENLPESGPVIFTPNHPNSLLDPILVQFLPGRFELRFVAKAPLFKIPVFGSILRHLRAIPVVRKFEADGEVDYSAFFSASVDALKEGDCVVIFPEGRSLPQPFLAPLRTGPARLFFLARERSIRPIIMPIGLNYEQGDTFRSSALISIAKPIDTAQFENEYSANKALAVRGLVERIGESLSNQVLQADNFRDRELLVLLERVYNDANAPWEDRFTRLKAFETGLSRLRSSHANEIDRLRHLLSRYKTLAAKFGANRQAKFSLLKLLTGGPIAAVGLLFNWIPYKLVALLVNWKHEEDRSEWATFKIIYSLFLFPLFYVLETVLILYLAGWWLAVIFALFILPLSYFTLHFVEWLESVSFWSTPEHLRAKSSLERLRQRIVAEVDQLAGALKSAG